MNKKEIVHHLGCINTAIVFNKLTKAQLFEEIRILINLINKDINKDIKK